MHIDAAACLVRDFAPQTIRVMQPVDGALAFELRCAVWSEGTQRSELLERRLKTVSDAFWLRPGSRRHDSKPIDSLVSRGRATWAGRPPHGWKKAAHAKCERGRRNRDADPILLLQEATGVDHRPSCDNDALVHGRLHKGAMSQSPTNWDVISEQVSHELRASGGQREQSVCDAGQMCALLAEIVLSTCVGFLYAFAAKREHDTLGRARSPQTGGLY